LSLPRTCFFCPLLSPIPALIPTWLHGTHCLHCEHLFADWLHTMPLCILSPSVITDILTLILEFFYISALAPCVCVGGERGGVARARVLACCVCGWMSWEGRGESNRSWRSECDGIPLSVPLLYMDTLVCTSLKLH
jgi:hypothetical protein